MASLPTPEEVAGPFLTQYDVYYRRLDPQQKNEIGAMEAATFLKNSGLADDVLGKIWDLSDPNGKGTLDRTGFFVACKLVALVQDHQDCLACNLKNESPAPNFGDQTAPGAPTAKSAPKAAPSINFLVKPDEKRKYDALFDQLQPIDGKLPGDKVRQVMMGSKLPMPTLGKIWDLSDVDRDGMLDRYEFTVAMHLVYRNLQGDPVPQVLPQELSPAKVPKSLSPMPNINGAPKPAAVQQIEAVPWVVNSGERLRYNALFRQTDSDKDGFVSGVEIKNVFLQTGLPQNILAHIWNLCDMKQEGKLNPEQFSLAMWLIQRKQAGKDPPAALTPDMIPPSMRPKGQDAGLGSIYNNPELEMIAKEIQSMLSEKLQIEKEVQEIEYQMSLKNTECHSLQSEFDTLSATLKQLTNQRDVAQRRLDDLDTQKSNLNTDVAKMDVKIGEQRAEIEKLRTQTDEQEETLVKQEEEVHGKKREYEKLKDEEKQLLSDIKKTELEIQRLEEDIKLAGDIEEEAKEKLENLQEAEKHMIEGDKLFDNASEDCSNVPDNFLEPLRLNLELPDYDRLEKPRKPPVPQAPVFENSVPANDMVNSSVGWASNDAFASAFDNNIQFATAFDTFGSFSTTAKISPSVTASFDPFGFSNNSSKPFSSGFNEDEPPALAPRPDSSGGIESPTPALPPKNTAPAPKRPPPPRRPPPPGGGAPGRGGPAPPVPPPPKSDDSPDDPFGKEVTANSGSGGGFADFANFSSFDNPTKSRPKTSLAITSNKPFNQDSAFTSPTSNFKDFASDFSKGYNSDSAFGSSDPTPTHTVSSKQSNNQSQAKSTLEFNEDPFQNSNYRYGDPFELSGGDPFKDKEDPFTAPVTAAFGVIQPNEPVISDPFFNAPANQSQHDDPFSLTLSNSLKPKTDKDTFNNDPFAGAFGSPVPSSTHSGSKNKNQAVAGASDPFGSSFSDQFHSKDDWFASPPSTSVPKVDGVPRSSKKSKNSSKSLATNWGGNNSDPFNKNVLKVGHSDTSKSKQSKLGLTDFLTGSPLRNEATPVKEKKKHKLFPKLSAKGGSSGAHAHLKQGHAVSKDSLDQVQLKMAAEASKRAEQDRLRRLQLQEEQDLAYAIALSKAEAASLKNT